MRTVYLGDVAPAIVVKALLFRDDCHTIEPVLPLRVSSVLLVPVQTAAPPEIVPPTEPGPTVIVATVLLADAQEPLVTVAR